MIYASIFAALVVLWLLTPFVQLVFLNVPKEHKWAAARCFLRVGLKSLAVIVPSLAAPFVVPLALLFTRWEDNKLPWIFQWWDNDMSINGDFPEYSDPAYIGTTYYANAHPRSFWARYVWLGWRNRASKLSQMLGKTWADVSTNSVYFGYPGVNNDSEGFNLNTKEGEYQLLIYKRVFGVACYQFHWGYKIWAGKRTDRKPVANLVSISFSLLPWRGKK